MKLRIETTLQYMEFFHPHDLADQEALVDEDDSEDYLTYELSWFCTFLTQELDFQALPSVGDEVNVLGEEIGVVRSVSWGGDGVPLIVVDIEQDPSDEGGETNLWERFTWASSRPALLMSYTLASVEEVMTRHGDEVKRRQLTKEERPELWTGQPPVFPSIFKSEPEAVEEKPGGDGSRGETPGT